MRVFYGSTSYLFTEDLEMEGEAQIIQFNEALKSDVLKVPIMDPKPVRLTIFFREYSQKLP